MNSWDLITELLAAATVLPLAQRRGWLEASGHPQDIISEAMSLLEAWELDPQYLEIDSAMPDTLGAWRIVKELGHGGMGHIQLARRGLAGVARVGSTRCLGGAGDHGRISQGWLED